VLVETLNPAQSSPFDRADTTLVVYFCLTRDSISFISFAGMVVIHVIVIAFSECAWLCGQINRVVHEHISHADMTASDVANTWSLIASDGDMKVYKSEIEDSGAVVQHPLKAVHTVKVRLSCWLFIMYVVVVVVVCI